MTSLSRRNFIRGSATMPLAAWLASRGVHAAEPLVRYDASSEMGLQMLQVYADAVSKMRQRPEADPLGWVWQWYTHFVDGTTTKGDEITRIFGGTPTTLGALAGETWDTCQSHSGQNANNFLPWHRMFVFFFESIIRQVSQRPDFTLPYWDYTSYDPAKRGVLPEAFRLPDDPLFSALYRPDRKALANNGEPIQKFQPGDAMDISVPMAKANYSNSGGVQGFCQSLNSGIHSRIHVLVGTARNMGAVPYAGRDPLFFVHHANIDRLWASWNRNGGVNPSIKLSWAKKQFVFADAGGQRVSGRLRDYFDIAPLGYTYEEFIPANAAKLSANTSLLAQQSGVIPETIASARSTELGARPVHATLLRKSTAGRTQVLGLDASRTGQRTYLVLKDLHTWAQPEVLYHLYLTPTRSAGRLDSDAYVGNINFFDAEFHDHGHGAMGDVLADNLYSFDVTALLQAIARGGNPNARDALLLTFVPGGVPTAGARPLVATIELLRQ